ncbi:hypothetical protein [Streptomyces sp. NPDC088794]|uniref:hypothetical protein n=1 Tax=Streptomyces sp. NPDC088794 TaxID=3365902 RepID=UPI003809B3BE
MTTPSRARSLRVAAAASVLTVIAGAVILAPKVRVPQGWWPRTGQAFAAGAHAAHADPCALIAGPGNAYCERDTTDGAHRLVPAGTGPAVLVVWQLRSLAEQRRR